MSASRNRCHRLPPPLDLFLRAGRPIPRKQGEISRHRTWWPFWRNVPSRRQTFTRDAPSVRRTTPRRARTFSKQHSPPSPITSHPLTDRYPRKNLIQSSSMNRLIKIIAYTYHVYATGLGISETYSTTLKCEFKRHHVSIYIAHFKF